jgi:hypothetical protein
MTTKETSAKAGVFECPACAQRHRADLTPLATGKSAAMRTTCAGCRRTLVVEWREGGPLVRVAGEPAAIDSSTPVPETRRGPRRRRLPEGSAEAEGTPEAQEVPAEFAPGTSIGRYRLEQAIGHGGTGTVYRAFDPTTNRYVALKILAKELKDERRDRFLREIEVQANLRHPHIMPGPTSRWSSCTAPSR